MSNVIVGTPENARKALHTKETGIPCEGWKYLGAGVHRQAWLAPDGVVYKVCASGDEYANTTEVKLCRDLYGTHPLGDTGALVGIPPASLYLDDRVVAMGYVGGAEFDEGDHPGVDDELCRTWICDPHSGNVRMVGRGLYVLIDLGLPSSNSRG